MPNSYQVIVMFDSNRVRAWTVSTTENAVRSAFFLQADEDGNLPLLRYTDIIRTISKEIAPMNDSTLSRALKSMYEKGELRSERKGRENWYLLRVEMGRDLLVEISLESDLARIRRSSLVGTTARLDEGWSCYGVPITLRNRIHSKLRQETSDFQDGIDTIIEEEFKVFMDSALRKARGRLSKGDAKKARNALREVLDEASDRSRETITGELNAMFLERIAPGTTELALKSVTPQSFSDERARIKYLSKVYDLSEEEAAEALDASRRTFEAISRLIACLHGRDRRWFIERFVALQYLGAHLIAVVR